jgi:hypothetical protein
MKDDFKLDYRVSGAEKRRHLKELRLSNPRKDGQARKTAECTELVKLKKKFKNAKIKNVKRSEVEG